jgi:hypothetical protein
MYFSRIKKDSLDQAIELAQGQGIEHVVLATSESVDWSTLQFTTDYSRKRFENLCSDNDILVDGKQIVQSMVDSVVEGKSPSDVLDEALTNGMRNALSKMKVKSVCKNCDLHIPTYPGKYPNKCPSCEEIL